ncbi:MAG TPA: Lrp/AsnC family transcriptional regulator [Ignavibacteriaceae bacterium]|nr:Lrp/AsnC family transcriptional regulator [Ignavibacteriaceae bacterium]
MTRLNATDKKILEILQTDAKITNVELAAKVGISPPAMLERVKKLESSGIIEKYVALVNPQKVGRETFAMVSVSLTQHQLPTINLFVKEINKLEEVLECFHVTGKEDFLLKVVVKNIPDYEKFILEKLTKIKGVSRVNTTFILSAFKLSTKIPVDNYNDD